MLKMNVLAVPTGFGAALYVTGDRGLFPFTLRVNTPA
jgi:hypothetical protein